MSKLTDKIKNMPEVFVSLNTIEKNEIGTVVFNTEDPKFDEDENPRGKLVTPKGKYAITLAGVAGMMLVAEKAKAPKAEAMAPTTDKLYRNKEFHSVRKLIQDADENAKPVEEMEFKCVGHSIVVDRETGVKQLQPWQYKGDSEYFETMRAISTQRAEDPTGNYAQQYADARKALVDSGTKPNYDKEDFVTRPIFVLNN